MSRMSMVFLAAVVLLAGARPAWSLDTVKTTKGTVLGRITGQTPFSVQVDTSSGLPRSIGVNEIVSLTFDSEPAQLKTAKKNALEGRYDEALATLDKIDAGQLQQADPKQEADYYRAYCRARLALGGSGEITAAGKGLLEFLDKYRNSYHTLEANQLVGDLLVANGKYDTAETYYARLAEAPWPEAKARAALFIGRALLAQNKPTEAREKFNEVLAAANDAAAPGAEGMVATIGLARCLLAENKSDDARKLADEVIKKADLQQTDLLAEAYNALGAALRQAKQPKEAILAYLHVDLLYFNNPEARAEALANLVELYREDKKPEYETETRRRLVEQYANSKWAKAVK